MDPQKLENWLMVVYFNGETLQILLEPFKFFLGNSNGGGLGPSTTNVYREPRGCNKG